MLLSPPLPSRAAETGEEKEKPDQLEMVKIMRAIFILLERGILGFC
jgi:hypothetical protein